MFVHMIKPLRGITPLHDQPQEDRLDKLLEVIKEIYNANNNSPILEFGVGSGYSLANMKAFADKFNMSNQFIGFDSFCGLPESEGEHWKKGEFSHTFEDINKSFERLNNFKLIPGIFNVSLTENLKNELNISSASLIHIDCDLYSSTTQVLLWIKNLLKIGTWIVFDEWIFGENIAWENFIIQNSSIKYRIVDPSDEQRILQITAIKGN